MAAIQLTLILMLAGAPTTQSLWRRPLAFLQSQGELSVDVPVLDSKTVEDGKTWDLETPENTTQAVTETVASIVASQGGEYCGEPGWGYWKETFAGLAPYQDEVVQRAWEPSGNTTLLVEADLAAFNNVRMSQEVAVCIAYLTKRWYRAPVLNPQYSDDRLHFQGETGALRQLHLFDYYDEASFRRIIPTMNWTEPLEPPEGMYYAKPENVLRGSEPITNLSVSEQYRHIVFKGGEQKLRLLHQYAARKEFQPHSSYVHLIESAFRLRQDLLCRAALRLENYGLKPMQYVALHMRRGDLETYYPKLGKDLRSTEEIAKSVSGVIKNQTVLVLTDTYDEKFLSALQTIGGATRVVCWANLRRAGDDDVYNAQIDMLSAVPASKFIATPMSTFSTGIVRWRVQAGTHKIGQPVYFVIPFNVMGDWDSPGAEDTWL